MLKLTKKEVQPTPTVTVKDQTGKEIETFDSIDEAYEFASKNGYQVESK